MNEIVLNFHSQHKEAWVMDVNLLVLVFGEVLAEGKTKSVCAVAILGSILTLSCPQLQVWHHSVIGMTTFH